MKWLTIPWIDKTIAILACLPFLQGLYSRLSTGPLDTPRICLAVSVLLLVATMLARTTPVRITPNPFFWLLTFVATYWGLLTASLARAGTPIVPEWISDSLAILGLALVVYARVSLGRNIGFVPAQRELVTHGAYRFVRHPIYGSNLVLYVGFALHSYSVINILLVTLGAGWWIIKSLVEERFLSEDPEYTLYMSKVRWRWIPGLI
jgi:protein-S-isoprenylcysteine O-methyltransferase Ste14